MTAGATGVLLFGLRQSVRSALAAAALLLPNACVPSPDLHPDPHYVLGKPYQVGKIWYYPKDSFDFDETGLATIIRTGKPRLATDGEVFDQTLLAGAHPTLQLPAIARLTNLHNGREVTIRLNDRGSGDPARLLEVTSRTAALLEFPPDGIARVRLRLLPVESHAAAETLPGAPSLGMTAVPRGVVEVAELPPPQGTRAGTGRVLPAAPVAMPEPPVQVAPLARLPETVTQTPPRPGRLIVRLDTFDSYQYAAVQSAKIGRTNTRIIPLVEGRTHRFRVETGPLPDIAAADAALYQALAAGIPDARIVVD